MSSRYQASDEIRDRFLIFKKNLTWANELQWGSFHTDIACEFAEAEIHRALDAKQKEDDVA